jgi:hypothetical protein
VGKVNEGKLSCLSDDDHNSAKNLDDNDEDLSEDIYNLVDFSV